MKKALVIGVILLFLGVGLKPALANEIPISNTSDVDEDCGCEGVVERNVNPTLPSRRHWLCPFIESIYNSISNTLINIENVMEKFENNPIIYNFLYKILSLFAGLLQMNVYLILSFDCDWPINSQPNDNPKTCDTLDELFNTLDKWFKHVESIREQYWDNEILNRILKNIMFVLLIHWTLVNFLLYQFDCFQYPEF